MMKQASHQVAQSLLKKLSIDCIKKIDIARDEICHYEAYNMEDAQYAIVSYGGTARTAYEAMLEARKKGYKSRHGTPYHNLAICR